MNEMRLRGVGIGAGYFSHYQYESWSRMPNVEIGGHLQPHRSARPRPLPSSTASSASMTTIEA